MARFLLPTVFGCAVAVGCAPAPIERAPSPRDPSSTSAPEGVDPASVVATTAPAETRPAAGTTYACPMHPDVTSDRPGACPKCDMKLVPRK